MSWTAPRTWVSGELVSASLMNTHVRDNLIDLRTTGTWTPVLGGSGGTSGQTYSTAYGSYVKVGPVVFAHFFVALTAKGTITGNCEIQGLPLTSDSNAGNTWVSGPVRFANLSVNWIEVITLVAQSTAVAQLIGTKAAGAANTTALATADIGNTTDMRGTVIYLTAA